LTTFVLGDTAEQLAERNGHMKAATLLKHLSAYTGDTDMPPRNIQAVISNMASGDVIAEIVASTSWTVAMLQGAMERPSVGCYRFVAGCASLTPGIRLGDLCPNDSDVLQLSAIVMPAVTGGYHAFTQAERGRGRRQHQGSIGLRLEEDGRLALTLEATQDRPLPCANRPPAIEHVKVTFDGAWSAEPPGVVVTFNNGQATIDRRQHARPRPDPVDLTGTLKMILVSEGQLEVVERTVADQGFVPHMLHNFCAVGTVLVRGEPPSMRPFLRLR